MRLTDKSGKAAIWLVIAGLALLAASWHFIVQPARLGAMEKETRTSLEVLRNAIGKYYSQRGNYPETLDALIPTYVSKIPVSHPHPLPPSSKIQYVASAAALDYSGGWAFDNNTESASYGHLYVNAKGQDSKGKDWITY